MDYKREYEQAMLRMNKWVEGSEIIDPKEVAEFVFPELKESEDEKIKEDLIQWINEFPDVIWRGHNTKDVIAWLEKQGEPLCWIKCSDGLPNRDGTYLVVTDGSHNDVYDMAKYDLIEGWHKASEIIYWMPIPQIKNKSIIEQKPNDKVEPKFKVGDIVRHKNGDTVTITQIDTQHQIYYYKGWDDAATVHSDFSISEQDNWELVEQKPTDKVEPKFKVGDWIVEYGNVNTINQVIKVEQIDDEYFGYTLDDKSYFGGSWESSYRLWTIKDAKDGDVLYECNEKKPFIFKELKTKHIGDIASYCDIFNGVFNPNEDNWTTLDIVPATKEQRDLLLSKMKEAGYDWDSEKKKLKKIVQKPKIYDSMDDLIADALIEEIENSELDDRGKHNRIIWIKSHRKKPTWSEEECQIIKDAACFILSSVNTAETKEEEERLDKLADKLQNLRPQPKQEWSEDDERNYESAIWHIEKSCGKNGNVYNWLKSIKERHTWKPSNEQMEALLKLEEMHVLEHEKNQENAHLYMVIKSLKEQLLKLKGE